MVQDGHLPAVITRRVGFALVAYVCLLAQVSTFAHRAIVQHVTCAEHGEAIHVTTLASFAELAPSMSSRPVLPCASGVPAIVADNHDHCSVALSPSVKAPLQPRQGVNPAARFLARNGVCPRVRGTAVDTYLIAPKTSPPVRAA